MNLLAVVLVVWSGAHHPRKISHAHHAPPAQTVQAPAPAPLPSEKKLWFEDAIDHILTAQ